MQASAAVRRLASALRFGAPNSAPIQMLARFPLCIAVLLLCALAVRCGAAVWWQSRQSADRPLAMPDSESYWSLARTVARGEPYQFGGPDAKVFRAPGYPLLLGGWFWLRGGSVRVIEVRLLGAALGVVAVGLVGALAAAVPGDPQVRRLRTLAAMALATVYPGAIMMSVLVLSEALFCPLMLGHLICWMRLVAGDGKSATGWNAIGWAVASGALAGAAVLTRPSWALFAPLVGGTWWLAARARPRVLARLSLFVVAFVAVMTPWWLRNYRAVGVWVPTTLQVGASLYDGWSPTATGASDMRFVPKFRQQLREQDARGAPKHPPFEVRLDRAMRRAAVEWAAQNPVRVVQLMGIKAWRMWKPFPSDAQFQSALARWATLAGYAPLLLLCVAGWRAVPAAPRWLLCAPAAYFTLLHIVFVASIRYRHPPMLAAVALAACGAAAWLAPRPKGDA